ncbi:MAG TPA: hypothetical protein VMD08_00305 [Candidatus Baltobacteraceae bacterium]|nr:hypothetical protein [Candidatus Baltobacteraceae bacterium]
MRTIIEYTSNKAPENRFPQRIVSPPQSSACCFSAMEEVGRPWADGRWLVQYKRCQRCGFTVRAIVRYLPDPALGAELRKIFRTVFQRTP